MTNEEVIKQLKYCKSIHNGSFGPALKIAIKALEQEPCEDAISRQAVLDATVKKNSIWNSITNSKGENLEEIISQLPPVTPQQKTGHWIKTKECDDYETMLTDCRCSVCGEKALLNKSYSMDGQSIVLYPSSYCPNCGTKMQEELNDDEKA